MGKMGSRMVLGSDSISQVDDHTLLQVHRTANVFFDFSETLANESQVTAWLAAAKWVGAGEKVQGRPDVQATWNSSAHGDDLVDDEP